MGGGGLLLLGQDGRAGQRDALSASQEKTVSSRWPSRDHARVTNTGDGRSSLLRHELPHLWGPAAAPNTTSVAKGDPFSASMASVTVGPHL